MLPNGENAFVPPLKLKAYLLSETHPTGKEKAKFFRSVGFSENTAYLLKEGLLAIARLGNVGDVMESQHGVKYIIDGEIKAPTGGSIELRTVWIVDKGQERPRFVTAYPV